MESAEGLYSRLEEQLHELVSQSNSCLERLEFLQKVRQLEAEFSKVRRMSLERRSVFSKVTLSSAVRSCAFWARFLAFGARFLAF